MKLKETLDNQKNEQEEVIKMQTQSRLKDNHEDNKIKRAIRKEEEIDSY